MVEITDRESAKAWLRGQRREICVAMATRAALRSAAAISRSTPATLGGLVLPVFRAMLTSGLAGTWPSPEVTNAAARAAAAADAADAADAARAAAADAADAAARAAAAVARAAYAAADAAFSRDAAAAYAADAADAAAAYAAFSRDAARFEAGASAEAVFAAPLWADREELPALSEARGRLFAFLDADREVWSFWARWYRGMFDGRPMDWELQRQVALIPDTVWQDGPAAVAREIARIEAPFGPMAPEAARAQAKRLMDRPKVAATAAKGLAAIIQMAMDAYRREVCNALPEALEPLERLPGLLDTIAAKVISDCPEDELAQLVVMMAGTIAELNLRLRRAREEVKSRPVADEKRGRRSLIREGFYTSIGGMMSGALFSTAMWGALFMGSQTLMGPAAADLVDDLAQCYEDMIGPNADTPPELWAVPSLDA